MKAKFVFSFEKLLEHKRRLEDSARRDWLEAQAKADEATRELQGMYDQIENSRKRASDLESAGGAHAAHLSQIDAFINGQKIRIERFRKTIQELMAAAEEKHRLLVEAARERKILDKLKEKKQNEHRKMMKKHELKVMDDLVVTRYKVPGREV